MRQRCVRITVVEESWLNEEFGRLLRMLRTKAGLSQEALAEAAGLSRTSVVNIEAGRQGASLATLYRLADALGCDPARLLPAPVASPHLTIAIGVNDSESNQAVLRVLRRAQEGAQ